MNRALTCAAWTGAVLSAVALAVAATGVPWARAAAIALVVVTGVATLVLGGVVQRLPPVYLLALCAGGGYVVLAVVAADDRTATSTRVVDGLVEVAVNLVFVVAGVISVRTRRGPFTSRDLTDGLTMTVAGCIVAWIVVSGPLIDEQGLAVARAVLAGAYLPLGVLLVGITALLLVSGLHRNVAMWMLAGAITANLAADVGSGLLTSDAVGTGAADAVAASYVAAYVLACSAFLHPDVRDLRRPRPGPLVGRPNVRIAVVGGALVIAVAMTSAVPHSSDLDRAVRTALTVVLITLGASRLVHAVRASDAARSELLDRIQLDDLTRLPNRNALLGTLDDLLEATWRTEHRPAVMHLNLDRFKNINDAFGHDRANDVLRGIAERLAGTAQELGASVARPSGDEFIVIDPAVTSAAHALARAETVRAVFEEPFLLDGTPVFLTTSIGLVVAPRARTITSEEFLRRADIAIHQAKANGRNCVAIFDDSMQANLAQRMDLEHALHGAIDRHEMRLYHQPIVDLGNGEISGFEALIRWRRADGTLVPPNDFIPIAEETGTINALGSWAMLEALCELRRWIDDGIVPATTTMSVNVSPRQIADPRFPDIVQEALARSGVPPHLLWIEVTESMMLSEPELARATLRRVRAMGVRIALDDFGTGYSSLSLLQRFPLQRIKIDRAFVDGVADRSNDRSLVRTIIAMGTSLGLDIVAEGVESIHQLSTLRELGCSKAQGYLISHPIPADALRSTMVALQDLGSLSLFSSGSPAPPPGSSDLGLHGSRSQSVQP